MTSIDVVRAIATADLEGADVRYQASALLALCDEVDTLTTELAATKASLAAARLALAACREVREACRDQCDGMTCTLPKGHKGRHVDESVFGAVR